MGKFSRRVQRVQWSNHTEEWVLDEISINLRGKLIFLRGAYPRITIALLILHSVTGGKQKLGHRFLPWSSGVSPLQWKRFLVNNISSWLSLGGASLPNRSKLIESGRLGKSSKTNRMIVKIQFRVTLLRSSPLWPVAVNRGRGRQRADRGKVEVSFRHFGNPQFLFDIRRSGLVYLQSSRIFYSF